MKKHFVTRVFAAALAVILSCGYLPFDTQRAYAEEEKAYDLYVSGVQVTDKNKYDVLGDHTVFYSPSNNVLSLSNACISVEKTGASESAGIYYTGDDGKFTILLNGNNVITGAKYGQTGYGIYVEGGQDDDKVYIEGTGNLDIALDDSYSDGDAICTDSRSLYITNEGELFIDSAHDGIRAKELILSDNKIININAGETGIELGPQGGVGGFHFAFEQGAILEVLAGRNAIKNWDPNNSKSLKDARAYVGESRSDSMSNSNTWQGDTDSSHLSDYRFVRFPNKGTDDEKVEISFDPGDQGSGSMNEETVFMGSRYTVPRCGFEGAGDRVFDGWVIGSDSKKLWPGDTVRIDENTTFTATWSSYPENIFIGGVQVNDGNKDNVLGDGKVKVESWTDEVIITLNNATIEASSRKDGEENDTEYGIMYNLNDDRTLKLVLNGENKIVNDHPEMGIKNVIGIRANNANKVVYTGGGALSIKSNAAKETGKYYGIDSLQDTEIDNAAVKINITGITIPNNVPVKGYNLNGEHTLTLKNNALLDITTSCAMAFDSNSKGNTDIDVQKGSVFEAKTIRNNTDGWFALHGNGWVTFSDSSLAHGILVNTKDGPDGYMTFEYAKRIVDRDNREDIGRYNYVRIPDDHKHNLDEGTITKKPTETSVGEKTCKCDICDGDITEKLVANAQVSAKANAVKRTVKASWKKVSGATGYQLSYKTAAAKNWTAKKTGSTSLTVKNMKANGMYQFKVQTVADSVTGGNKNISYVYISSMKGLKYAAGKKKVTIRWKRDKKATGYRIQYATNKKMKNAKTVVIKGGSKTSKVIRKLKKGKNYYFRVFPVKKYKAKTYIGAQSAVKRVKVK